MQHVYTDRRGGAQEGSRCVSPVKCVSHYDVIETDGSTDTIVGRL